MAAAVQLLETDGVEGMTTRSVCEAAGVTAPTLYHHFGDKGGLIHAVVTAGVNEFMAMKRALRVTADPVADLRRGWESWIDFGLERPRLFRLMISAVRSDPTLGQAAYTHMEEAVERLEASNMLRISVRMAVQATSAAAAGVQGMFLQDLSAAEIKATSRFIFEALVGAMIERTRE